MPIWNEQTTDETFTPADAQDTFTLANKLGERECDIYLNGLIIAHSDYQITTSQTIKLDYPVYPGDTLLVRVRA